MSNVGPRRYHRLIIKASPRTDIWLADDGGHLVQKERGVLDTSLLPGNYVVEFGLGSQTYPIHLRKDSEYSQAEIQAGPSCPRPEVRLAPRYTASADSAIEALLGGKAVLKKKPTSVLDWVEVIRNGLPAAVIDSLLGAIQLSQTELARAVGIPERTLARRKREGVLNSDESAKLFRLARVVGRANAVFESPSSSIHWLKAPNASLGGRTPLSLMDTDIGAESVLDTLGRIEHGAFA